jgi:hypothetical protein
MPIATGIAKQLRYKLESAWGTAPGASGAQLLRRVSSDLNLKKDTYESNEIRTDYQVADYRHGVRRVEGTIRGELSPLTYSEFLAAACRKAWAATAAITGLSITIAGSGPTYTVTRAAGDFIAGGLKIGDVIRLTAGSFNAANLNNNLGIVNLTATVATVVVLNGSALVAEGPIASATVSVPGKRVWTPITGHTDQSFAIEHWFADIAQSELFLGCKVNTIGVALPATGMATIDVAFMGKDVTTATAQYFTSPNALTSSGITAAVNGVVRYGNGKVSNISGAQLNYNGGMSTKPVIGSNTVPDIFEGRVRWDGQFTAMFEDATYRDAFLNETAVSFTVWLTANNLPNSDFIGFTVYNAKLNDSAKSDGEEGLEQTVPFVALFNSAGGAAANTEQTTVLIQDSLVP